jgi:hypothetical protein
VFNETKSSQKEQVNLDLVDDKEAICNALQRMTIGEVRPQDPSNQAQEINPNDTTPSTQRLDQNEHKDKDEHQNQVQEESNDQGEDVDDRDKGEGPPYPRVCHNIKRDHPIDNKIGDIKKEVMKLVCFLFGAF